MRTIAKYRGVGVGFQLQIYSWTGHEGYSIVVTIIFIKQLMLELFSHHTTLYTYRLLDCPYLHTVYFVAQRIA